MSRPAGKRFPNYPARAHTSGQARVKIGGRAVYLGVHGSPESWAEYRRRLAAWQEGGTAPEDANSRPGALTIRKLVAAFMTRGARERYIDPDGRPKAELQNFPFSLAPLLARYGSSAVSDFGAVQLKKVLRSMIAGDWRTVNGDNGTERPRRWSAGWSRNVCNWSLSRIKLVFRWGESEGLVPRGTAEHLATVAGLEVDQGGVRETDDVAPVPEKDVAATLPHCNHVVRAIVELLMLTAARPKEIRLLRPVDIDRDGRIEIAKGFWVTLGGGCWAVRLRKHKTAHKKQRRIILLGPRAQEILRPFMSDSRAPTAYLFCPREAMKRRDEERRAKRKTPVQPSQLDRRKQGATARKPGEYYERTALQRAIRYACDAAEKAERKKLADAERGMSTAPSTSERLVPRWSPYRLRHLAAVNLVQQFGWDTARVILGHTEEEMSRRYGSEDYCKAAKAIGEAG